MAKLSLKLKKTKSKTEYKETPQGQTSIQSFFSKNAASGKSSKPASHSKSTPDTPVGVGVPTVQAHDGINSTPVDTVGDDIIGVSGDDVIAVPMTPDASGVVTSILPDSASMSPNVIPETPERTAATSSSQATPLSSYKRKVTSLRRKHSISPGDGSPPAKQLSKGTETSLKLTSRLPFTGPCALARREPAKAKSNPFAVSARATPTVPASPQDILGLYDVVKESTPFNGSDRAQSVQTQGQTTNASSSSLSELMTDGLRHQSATQGSAAGQNGTPDKTSPSGASTPKLSNRSTVTPANAGKDSDSSFADDDLLSLYGQVSKVSQVPSCSSHAASNHPTVSPVSTRKRVSGCASPSRPSHVVSSLQSPPRKSLHTQSPVCVSKLRFNVPETPEKPAAQRKPDGTPGNTSLDAEDYTALLECCLDMTPVKATPTPPSTCADEDIPAISTRDPKLPKPVYSRFLVLEVYSRDATVSSGQTSWNVSEKVLRLLDEKHGAECQCLLRDDWLHTAVEPGDIVHISGQFNSDGVCLLANTDGCHGYLVVQPDTLVSTTSVATATRCLRRAALGERFKGGGGDITEALLVGVMIHEIFDMAMRAGNFSVDYTKKLAQKVAERQDFLHMMYALQQTQDAILGKILEQLTTLYEWSSKFLHKEPKIAQGLLDMASTFQCPSDEQHSLAISRLRDIEENIWSPRFGLKGKVDATVEIKIHKRRPIGGRRNRATPNLPAEERFHWTRVPLELKTGRQTASSGTVDHRAQVILYTMMLADAHSTDVPAGLLLYSKTGKMLPIPALGHELRALLMRRNELTRYLALGRSASSAWSANRGAGLLPAMLLDEHTCKYCPQLRTCALLHRSVENGTTESSGMGNHFTDSTDHLSDEQLSFFADWYRLIGLEASCATSDSSLQTIWTHSVEERIEAGRCCGHLQISQAQEGRDSSSWRTRFTMASCNESADGSTVLEVPLNAGEMVVVSEQHGRLALCTGFVTDISLQHVEVTVDRQLPRCDDNSDVIEYCIDANSGMNEGKALWGNLASLFVNSEDRDSRLRSLVVELSPPRFARSSLLTRSSLGSQSTLSQLPCTFSAKQFQSVTAQLEQMEQVDEILDTLNSDQKHAVDRALCAQDYALILGMPGTGKTTTIACLVQILVLCGKRVLLTSYTHSAVDNILLKLVKSGVDFVRLGRPHKVHPTIHPYVAEIACSQFSTVAQLEQFYKDKKVMATTCHGIGHSVLSQQSFDICIVDEASQITLPMCVGPIRLANSFILVGDQYQLPPLVQSAQAREGGMAVSLFRRLAEAHPAAVTNLQQQYRMHKDVMLLSNTLVYSHRLKCGTQQVATQLLPLSDWTDLSNPTSSVAEWLVHAINPKQPVVFLNTDKVPGPEQTATGLVYNEVEAMLVALLVKGLLKAGANHRDLGVISIYRQQLKVISRLLQQQLGLGSNDTKTDHQYSDALRPDSPLQEIEVNTIDRYQGRDKPCVIVSLVRSNSAGKVGQLLLDWRRANVAVTRAKYKLILIGSASTLRRSHLFKLLLDLVQQESWIIDVPLNGHMSKVE